MSSMDALVDHCIKVAVAQVLKETGFNRIQKSALDTLSDLVRSLITEIATLSNENAALASRSETTYLDIEKALCAKDWKMEELIKWCKASDPLPFAHRKLTSRAIDLPPLPLAQEPVLVQPKMDSIIDKGKLKKVNALELARRNATNHPHVPPYFPQLPENRTYKDTDIFVEQEYSDPVKKKRKVLQERRQVEKSLVKLHQAEEEERDNTGTGL